MLRFDPTTAQAEILDAVPATGAADDNYPAEIALSADERRLYVASRERTRSPPSKCPRTVRGSAAC